MNQHEDLSKKFAEILKSDQALKEFGSLNLDFGKPNAEKKRENSLQNP